MKMKKLMVAALAAAITVGSALPASAAWVQSGSDWKYQNEDGSWQTGKWFQEAGKWYHFDADSNAQKGWFKDTDGKWYFFAYNGIMQTGLIKVDEKVYYMNADGSLFTGTMKFNNIDYNFTEYGTTNGKPAVGASQTFGGNGNQTNVIKGGGGYSSSSGGSGGGSSSGGSTESSEKTAAKAAVKEAFEAGISDADTDGIVENVAVAGTTISFTVTDPAVLVSGTNFVETVQNSLDKVLESGAVSKVKIGTREFTEENAEEFSAYADIYGELTIEDAISILNKKNITVYTADGEAIKYSVSSK
ncbi:hypothetical protein AALB39_15105 [Lachnospiraceae bacterium 54-53]